MEDALRNILIGVATSLSVVSIGVGINTYVDVQILKNNQTEQSDIVKTTREILSRIDKTQAVQTETIKALLEVVSNLKTKDNRGGR